MAIILDAKTDYSFMRGFGTPKQWLARCKELGVTAFGIADYCSTWGHTPFSKAFKGSSVKLLYGVQVPVVSRLERDPRHSLVTLIARDDVTAIYKLMSLAHQQMYFRPRVTWEQVEEISQTQYVILNYVNPLHTNAVKKLNTIHAYAGVSPDYDLAAEFDYDPVYAYGPRFPSPEHRQAFELMRKIAGDHSMGEIEFRALHLLRPGEANSVLPIHDEATDSMAVIATEATAELKQGTLISNFKPKNKKETKMQRLGQMAILGAKKLGFVTEDEGFNPYAERLDRELKVIQEKKFEDYFFFVADLVDWARDRMFVGPGRGSSGGSLLCYFLGITTVDPLIFGTMFERFIDITRPDWPDIDIDFPDNRREEVFTYLKEKYGEGRVARLGTLSEFGGKSALNDTARAMGIPGDVARALGKFTEGGGQGMVISPSRLWGENGLLDDEHMKIVAQYPKIKLAAEIDGHVRHHGVHAAGIVVTQDPVVEYGTINKEGVIEMDMKGAEDIGLLKMDALGLRTLSVIQEACDIAKIDSKSLFTLDWADDAVYEKVFRADRVTGVFQFEGNAVRSLMKGVRVERFDDICALTSLARPGPLIGGAAEHWAKCRMGLEEARELHPALESTYGVICYQEQAMAIVRDLAGFTEPEVNGFRRAVGKKDPEKLKGYREKFVDGAEHYFSNMHPDPASHTEASREKANELWDELCEFGSYAFNLAHAVEYAMISYIAAWLKVHYPLAFAAACLRHVADDEQGKNLLRELTEEGYAYVPFDAVRSMATWSIIDGKLYGGFDSVKGVGSKTAQKLLEAREADPEGWLEKLTEAQRNRLTKEFNTPWHDLTYFGTKYAKLYERPDAWRGEGIAAGFRGPVLRIRDIPEKKGNYAFIGRIVRKQQKDYNDPVKVAQRGGSKAEKDNVFWSVLIEDDTGQMWCTINRFKSSSFRWFTDSVTDDRDFFFRGNIIADGRKSVFLDNIVELK